jgi:nucleoside-diphosphate-sugar epimerase
VTERWADSLEFWRAKRVVVTGGAGFLGTYVVQKLRERGAAEIIVPRSSQYDPSAPLRACLRDSKRLMADRQVLLAICHLLILGAPLLHESWVARA